MNVFFFFDQCACDPKYTVVKLYITKDMLSALSNVEKNQTRKLLNNTVRCKKTSVLLKI